MAWGSAKRRISGKIASGAFQKPDNTLQKGIMAAGDIAVTKIMKAQEEERLEERRKKAAAAAEAKRLAAEQRKKEEEAQKLARQAKAIATRYGAQGNTEFINYATEQLYTFGDSAAALIESDYKSGRLAIGEKETGPMQGPLLQPMTDDELRIAENTTLDAYRAAEGDADPNTPDAKTNIVTSFKADGGIDAQMNSILDKSGALSDEQIASQTYEGITIDPDAKETAELDSSKLRTIEDIELYEAEIAANGLQLSDAALQTIADRKETLTQRKTEQDIKTALETRLDLLGKDLDHLNDVIVSPDTTPEQKATAQAIVASRPGEEFDITKFDDVDDATIQTVIDAPNTDPKKVTQLQALLANRKAQAPVLDTDSADYQITFMGEDGKLQTTIAKLSRDGTTYVDLSDPTKTVQPAEGTTPVNLERSADLYDDLVKITQSTIKPLKTQRINMATTLESAKKLDDLVNPATGGNPEILTMVGGKIPAFIKSFGLETEALVKLFEQNGDAEQVFNTIDNGVSAYLAANTSLGDMAKNAALFQAERIKLAFFIASSSFGQQGTGLSNKDFNNALQTIDSGKDYDTFTTNLRSQVSSVVTKTERTIQDFSEDATVRLLTPLDPTGEIFDGYTQTAEQYAASRGLAEQFAWVNGQAAEEPEALARPTSKEEYDALPSGTRYIAPDGSTKIKK